MRYEIEYLENENDQTLALDSNRDCLLATLKVMKKAKNIKITKVYRVNKNLIYTEIKY